VGTPEDIDMTELTLPPGRTGAPMGHAPSTWQQLRAHWQHWRDRQVAATRRRGERQALHELSDATLRDLGIARCELESMQAEIEGQVEATRMRVHRHERRCRL
jgi:uncharacterized protein YjiS (DUF1127 family)